MWAYRQIVGCRTVETSVDGFVHQDKVTDEFDPPTEHARIQFIDWYDTFIEVTWVVPGEVLT